MNGYCYRIGNFGCLYSRLGFEWELLWCGEGVGGNLQLNDSFQAHRAYKGGLIMYFTVYQIREACVFFESDEVIIVSVFEIEMLTLAFKKSLGVLQNLAYLDMT